MKITVLGSAAAEAWPALWCECAACAYAREHGGKELRRRTSYLIDHDTLVDFGPDAYWQTCEFKIDLSRIVRLIVTHPHTDHINPTELTWRITGFSLVTHPLRMIAGRRVPNTIRMHEGYSLEDLKLEFVPAEDGRWMTDGDMEILPVCANHAPGLDPRIYVLRRGGKSILIGNDTGFLFDAQWEFLRGVHLDAAILDGTMGIRKWIDSRNGHMGGNVVVEFRDKLREIGCLDARSQVVVNHFSHNGASTHQEFCDFYGKHEIAVAYDGMTLEL